MKRGQRRPTGNAVCWSDSSEVCENANFIVHLRQLRNNSVHKNPINELSQGPMLKGFIWHRSSFVYSPISLTPWELGPLCHLNHISLCHFWSALLTVGIPTAQHYVLIYHSLFSILSFRVKTCIRPTKTCLRKTLQRFCWGPANWLRPKLKDKPFFRQRKVRKQKRPPHITHSLDSSLHSV